jgi:hypothetical protein
MDTFYTDLFIELTAEIDEITPNDELFDALQVTDVLLGTLPKDLQRILAVCIRHEGWCQQAFFGYQSGTPTQGIKQQLFAHRNRREMLYHLLWDGVRAHFGVHTTPMTIRKGWLLVEVQNVLTHNAYTHMGMLDNIKSMSHSNDRLLASQHAAHISRFSELVG